MSNLIKQIFNSHIWKMSSVIRYTWTKTLHQENIAEHSYYVSILSDTITEDILKHHNIELDRYKILKYAIYHDFEEVFTGDIITPVKNKSNKFKEELEKIANELVNEWLQSDFNWNDHIINNITTNFHEYEEKKYDNIENQIVKFSDQLEALMFSISEYKLWNSNFKSIIKDIVMSIDKNWSENKYFKQYVNTIHKITIDLI